MAGRAFVVLAIAPLVAGQSCHALDVIHAHCQVSVTAQTSCKAVQDEMVSRVASISTGAWHDPHNNGIYSLESQTDAQLEFKRVTGNKMFTDKLKFDFEDVDGTCKIHGCSQSQIPSVADFSTNYCNLRMLYCITARIYSANLYRLKSERSSFRLGFCSLRWRRRGL